jgi:hypothetical protein
MTDIGFAITMARDHHGAERGAADDDELGGLDQRPHVTMVHHEAADHASEQNDEADDDEHGGEGREGGRRQEDARPLGRRLV